MLLVSHEAKVCDNTAGLQGVIRCFYSLENQIVMLAWKLRLEGVSWRTSTGTPA